MNDENLGRCEVFGCDGWYCVLTDATRLVTFLAAALGLLLCGMILYRFRNAPVGDIGTGLAGMLAIAVLLMSLPTISKITVSFAEGQNLGIEWKAKADAENVCTVANLVKELTGDLEKRVATLEALVGQVEARTTTMGSPDSPGEPTVESALPTSSTDVRIYFRTGRREDAERILRELRTRYLLVDIVNTDLTELGVSHEAGFNRVRFDDVEKGRWLDDARTVFDLARTVLNDADIAGPDPVSRRLPGDVQVLLY
jgi:hypothetical protein